MLTAGAPCRTYIVYRHGLFAQGVRSVLEAQGGVQVVGMETDWTKALKAVRTLRPGVVIVENARKSDDARGPWAFLEAAGAERVVSLSLERSVAVVYDRHRIAVSDGALLLDAVHGDVHEMVREKVAVSDRSANKRLP